VGRIGVDEDRRHLRDEKLQTMIPNEPKLTSGEIVAHNRSVGSGDLRVTCARHDSNLRPTDHEASCSFR
jgi:hypothetical protein